MTQKKGTYEQKQNFSDEIIPYEIDHMDERDVVVEEVISGNIFKTKKDEKIQLYNLQLSFDKHKQKHKYNLAKSDLSKILKQNTKVRIKPIKKNNLGNIIARVEASFGDITKKMHEKGWSEEKHSKIVKPHKKKHKWHEKYKK